MEEQKLLKRKKRASTENDKMSLITACIKLAEYYFTTNKYDLAIAEYVKVGMLYKALNKPIDYAQCNRMIGEAYSHLKQYNKALKHQNIHLKIAIEEANKLEEQRAHATLGHTYLTRYEDVQNIEDLGLAEKCFKKSLAICERLNGINQREHMDMTARLFANLAVVDECLANYDKAIQLVQKCIDICKAHDIFEQLERGYAILGSIYNKKGDYKNAIAQYNLAIEVASRLQDKENLISAVLLAKGDIFIKLSDFSNAKNILLKAYKLKSKNHDDHIEDLEHTLKIVAVMSYTEDRLLTISNDDYETKKQLYEKMGDGASSLKVFAKAIDYYKKMLQAAIDNKEPEINLGSCYFSLAQTYYDDEQYANALEFFQKYYRVCKNNLKEGTSTLISIAEVMDTLGKNSDDVEKIYEQAIALCKEASDNHLEGKTISKYMRYLQKYNLDSKAEQLQEELNKLAYYVPSDTESDGTEIQTTSNIGEDINIDDITDGTDDENELPRTRATRKRNKTITMKKNAKGETQLHTACINGNYDVVKQLIERGHLINVRDNCGWLPLHEACNHGHLDIVKLLVEKGAAVNDRGGIKCDGVTPLHDAAVNGHLEIVEYLMDNGASLISKKDNGETPLHCLQSWRQNVQNTTAATQTHYELISRRMLEALERSGHACDIVLEDDAYNAALVSESDHLLANKKNKRIAYTLSSSDDELMEIDKVSSDESASDAESIHSGSKATEQYQEVMKSLRYRSSNEKSDNSIQQRLTKRSALLDPDEVGDDWLDDDLGRMKKRKTFNTFTSTSGIRNTNQVSATKEQTKLYSPPRQPRNFNVVDFKENHEPSTIRNKKKSGSHL
ncbi:tonsoku-like protein [Holotrichia oblita]|uniref:Tonsoku-like protein n=1 Tax=Holotrichia oblita TaxID=644536 RepID=A0ACB9TWI6_HOLOL|nr:tonsoku-like protein [Holotrichia oblita]